MDIIKFGDFLISNSQGKTFFSFASPPLPIRLNLVDQVKQIN
uniref:Uncharacterized protein n=1 Tax=uncultured bacterium contig00026 TaxID=1181515 RepID=A0A806KMN9_9BACT|nr:hypothetical protein [uncultured bacterium contig00026]